MITESELAGLAYFDRIQPFNKSDPVPVKQYPVPHSQQ
jgi:hypothetical protein